MREEGKEGDGEEETVKEGDDNGGHESKTKGKELKQDQRERENRRYMKESPLYASLCFCKHDWEI